MNKIHTNPHAVVVKYQNTDYYWHDRQWTTKNNVTICTSLTQKLMLHAIQLGILKPEDFNSKEEAVPITKTEADFKKK